MDVSCCCASWIWVIDIFFSKSLYTRAFHLRVRYLWFSIALMLMVVAIYDVMVRKTRLRAINILWWVSRRFNFGNILFIWKPIKLLLIIPRLFSQQWIWVLLFWEFYRILVLKKNEPKKLFRTCIRVSLYCINCAVANLRLDCFISFGVL
jgi:hypothetical protein